MNTEARLARDAIREEYARVEARIAPSVHGAVLQEGQLAGLAFALGVLGAPDPFAGLTGPEAVGADPSHAWIADRRGWIADRRG